MSCQGSEGRRERAGRREAGRSRRAADTGNGGPCGVAINTLVDFTELDGESSWLTGSSAIFIELADWLSRPIARPPSFGGRAMGRESQSGRNGTGGGGEWGRGRGLWWRS